MIRPSDPTCKFEWWEKIECLQFSFGHKQAQLKQLQLEQSNPTATHNI